MKDPKVKRLYWFAACVGLIVCGIWVLTSSRKTTTPRNARELRALEARFESVSEASSGAVVAIRQPNSKGYATGAIVSPDGLVVSSFHVTHRLPWDGTGDFEYLKAGEMTTVVLADGTKCDAELLGAVQTSDISMLKLKGQGPYPYLKISKNRKPKLGDWVLKIGHPTGLKSNRPPVTRAGRVLISESEFFVTDCNITGGDSGGPYVDLEGEIIGLPSVLISDERQGFLPMFDWARNKSGAPILLSAVSAHEILSNWDRMLAGDILPLKGDPSRQNELLKLVDNILPDAEWTRGGNLKKAFKFLEKDSKGCVVSILDSNGKQVSLGTICSPNGRLVTLNSTLPAQPRCKLPEGSIVACEIIRRSKHLNLALLKIPANNDTRAVRWAGQPSISIGNFVAAPNNSSNSGSILNIGIVSTVELAPNEQTTHEHFEIDMRLSSDFCGGSVLNLDGESIGITIRSNIYGTIAIPAAVVNDFVDNSPEK